MKELILLWDMALKQLKVRYAGSILGISWAVFSPFLIVLVVSFVFSRIFHVTLDRYPYFILSGMFPWLFFAGALSGSASSLLSHQGLLRQYDVSRWILPWSGVLSDFLNYLVGWAVLLPVFAGSEPRVVLMIPGLVFLLLMHLLFLGGLASMVSILNVYGRDLGHALGVLLMFWLWVTPVFYAGSMVPEGFRWVGQVNPMTPFIEFYHDLLWAGTLPGPSAFLKVAAWAFLSCAAGFVVFKRLEPQLLKKF